MTIACQQGAVRTDEVVLVVPAYVKEWVDRRLRTRSDKAPNLTIGQWLEAQPDRVRRREHSRLLGKLGLVSLER